MSEQSAKPFLVRALYEWCVEQGYTPYLAVRVGPTTRVPIEFVKTACTLKVQHVRTRGRLEFPLNPPGLEILDHTITLSQALCDSYPTGVMTQTWLGAFNIALDAYLGPKVNYVPDPYPYNDPRSGLDPSQR